MIIKGAFFKTLRTLQNMTEINDFCHVSYSSLHIDLDNHRKKSIFPTFLPIFPNHFLTINHLKNNLIRSEISRYGKKGKKKRGFFLRGYVCIAHNVSIYTILLY